MKTTNVKTPLLGRSCGRLFLLLAFIGLSTANAQVGIDTATPDASAALDIQATDKGLLPPRLTTAERDAIANPAVGLMIYNKSVKCLQWYVGDDIWHDGCGDNPYLKYPDGTVFCESGPTEIVEVTGAGGRVWMDRNLGASQVATSSTDAAAYGDLYQWGRAADGHQCRTSETTTTLSSTNQPANGDFIGAPSLPEDWRSPQNNNLWQGVNGVNNPCPTGYRLPTITELNTESTSWSSINATNAYASPLKLPMAGDRNRNNGGFGGVGSRGHYWSSTVSGTGARRLYFAGSAGNLNISARASGFSVRCIKN